jgi:predicted nuclease of predicted toxin-antitoxin system
MKLLFDENLSPRLPALLASVFPGSKHVRDCGLRGFPDEAIWEFARANGFTIISKDSDFQQRGLLYGHPPKIVWLRVGNCTREILLQIISHHVQDILDLDSDPFETMIVLSLPKPS